MNKNIVRSTEQLLASNTLVRHYAGSHAYGMALPTSDVDIRGIFCADPVNIRTPFFPVRETEEANQDDSKLFELNHFMKLCVDCNPNIIETLWVDQNDIIESSDAYQHLRQHRQNLLSTKVAHTTSGYAFAQLKRIRGHHKWISNPQPEQPPKQKDFVSMVQWFGENKMMPRDFTLDAFNKDHRLVPFGHNIFGLYPLQGYSTFSADGTLNTTFEDQRSTLGAPLAIVKFNKEQYNEAKENWNNYWKWKNNRNPQRSAFEEQFGFDTKHASHLVRLLHMGYEALTEGVIKVKRPDADQLLHIRNGGWTYEQIITYADHMDQKIKEAKEKSSLPKKPDTKLAAQLLMEVQDLVWTNQTNN